MDSVARGAGKAEPDQAGGKKHVAFTVKVSGPGVAIQKEVSADVASRITALVIADPEAVPDVPTRGIASAPHTPISPREFLLKHRASDNVEKIATIAEYLKTHRSKDYFDRQALVEAFQEAKEPVPKNLPRDLSKTIERGWIAQKPGDRSSYYLTGKGIDAVNAGFQ